MYRKNVHFIARLRMFQEPEFQYYLLNYIMFNINDMHVIYIYLYTYLSRGEAFQPLLECEQSVSQDYNIYLSHFNIFFMCIIYVCIIFFTLYIYILQCITVYIYV